MQNLSEESFDIVNKSIFIDFLKSSQDRNVLETYLDTDSTSFRKMEVDYLTVSETNFKIEKYLNFFSSSSAINDLLSSKGNIYQLNETLISLLLFISQIKGFEEDEGKFSNTPIAKTWQCDHTKKILPYKSPFILNFLDFCLSEDERDLYQLYINHVIDFEVFADENILAIFVETNNINLIIELLIRAAKVFNGNYKSFEELLEKFLAHIPPQFVPTILVALKTHIDAWQSRLVERFLGLGWEEAILTLNYKKLLSRIHFDNILKKGLLKVMAQMPKYDLCSLCLKRKNFIKLLSFAPSKIDDILNILLILAPSIQSMSLYELLLDFFLKFKEDPQGEWFLLSLNPPRNCLFVCHIIDICRPKFKEKLKISLEIHQFHFTTLKIILKTIPFYGIKEYLTYRDYRGKNCLDYLMKTDYYELTALRSVDSIINYYWNPVLATKAQNFFVFFHLKKLGELFPEKIGSPSSFVNLKTCNEKFSYYSVSNLIPSMLFFSSVQIFNTLLALCLDIFFITLIDNILNNVIEAETNKILFIFLWRRNPLSLCICILNKISLILDISLKGGRHKLTSKLFLMALQLVSLLPLFFSPFSLQSIYILASNISTPLVIFSIYRLLQNCCSFKRIGLFVMFIFYTLRLLVIFVSTIFLVEAVMALILQRFLQYLGSDSDLNLFSTPYKGLMTVLELIFGVISTIRQPFLNLYVLLENLFIIMGTIGGNIIIVNILTAYMITKLSEIQKKQEFLLTKQIIDNYNDFSFARDQDWAQLPLIINIFVLILYPLFFVLRIQNLYNLVIRHISYILFMVPWVSFLFIIEYMKDAFVCYWKTIIKIYKENRRHPFYSIFYEAIWIFFAPLLMLLTYFLDYTALILGLFTREDRIDNLNHQNIKKIVSNQQAYFIGKSLPDLKSMSKKERYLPLGIAAKSLQAAFQDRAPQSLAKKRLVRSLFSYENGAEINPTDNNWLFNFLRHFRPHPYENDLVDLAFTYQFINKHSSANSFELLKAYSYDALLNARTTSTSMLDTNIFSVLEQSLAHIQALNLKFGLSRRRSRMIS